LKPETKMNLTTRQNGDKQEIFDPFRKKWVTLTPEEWVRQHFARFLVEKMNYPLGRIGIEISLEINRQKRRCDIVVFDGNSAPWMIVECKAEEVVLNEKTFEQAAQYNYIFRAAYITLTNGKNTFCLKPDYVTGKVAVLDFMPAYLE